MATCRPLKRSVHFRVQLVAFALRLTVMPLVTFASMVSSSIRPNIHSSFSKKTMLKLKKEAKRLVLMLRLATDPSGDQASRMMFNFCCGRSHFLVIYQPMKTTEMFGSALNAHGYNLPRSDPILVAGKSDKILTLPLWNATNRAKISSVMAKNKHFKIVQQSWIALCRRFEKFRRNP